MTTARITAVLTLMLVIGIVQAFELNGNRWPGSHPRIPVYVSTSLQGHVPYDGTFEQGVEAIINAINEWSHPRDWNDSELQYYYAGLTDVDEPADDGMNVLMYKDEECPYGDACRAYIRYNTTDGDGEFDAFHGFDIVLYDNVSGSGTQVFWSVKELPDAWDSDLWFVTLHELGHGLGLAHGTPGKVMSTDCGTGCSRHHLYGDDAAGLHFLYGEYTNEGFWSSTETAAPGETFRLKLDYPRAANQQYRIYVDLTGDDGFPLRNWDSRDSRILPLNGEFLGLNGRRDVFVDFGANNYRDGCPGFCRTLDENGRAIATVNLPADAIEQFGNDLHFAVVTWDPGVFVNDIEDVSVGLHVELVDVFPPLDAGDVTVGGDGSGSGTTGAGVHPITGGVLDPDEFGGGHGGGPRFVVTDGSGGSTDLPFVDGVFMANGETQIDSTDGSFAFPSTSGDAWDAVRNGACCVQPDGTSIPMRLNDRPGEDRKGIGLHANLGVTFDLAAVREANPGETVASFRAVVGLGSAGCQQTGDVELWVLVDGVERYNARFVSCGDYDRVSVPLQPTDRFLTLVATDDDGNIDFDHAAFADATIVMDDNGCVADIDGSGDVDFADILAVLAAWGDEGGPEDIDDSGLVDFDDLLLVLAAYGPCP